jgi:hypothetical protein
MIHIKTDKLQGDQFEKWCKRARNARQKLLDEYKRTGMPPNKFNEQIWKDFKEAFLLEIHGEKCAYCEAKVSANADLHVEHYRPKGEVTVRNDINDHATRCRIEHPGYFWLAYEWYNLILSCPHCNSYHTSDSQWREIKHPGKLNEFCIENDEGRIYEPSDNPEEWFDQLNREMPLLLHPYFDYPENHITFDKVGIAYPNNGSERGRETIQTCDLNRPNLNDARLEIRNNKVFRAVGLVFEGRDVDNVVDGPFSAWIKLCVKIHIQDLQRKFNLNENGA